MDKEISLKKLEELKSIIDEDNYRYALIFLHRARINILNFNINLERLILEVVCIQDRIEEQDNYKYDLIVESKILISNIKIINRIIENLIKEVENERK